MTITTNNIQCKHGTNTMLLLYPVRRPGRLQPLQPSPRSIPRPGVQGLQWRFRAVLWLCCTVYLYYCADSTSAYIGNVFVWGKVVTLIVTTTIQKPEHSTALQPIMFGFFYAYSLYKRCIIGNSYGNCIRYRHRLLK